MVKRKTESAAQTDSKRVGEESRTKRTKQEGNRAKPAQQLHPGDDIQDFEPEKPQLKPKVCGKRAGSQRVCPVPARGNGAKSKPSKGGGKRGTCPVKGEAGEGTKGRAPAVVSFTGGEEEEEEGCSPEDSEDEWEEVEELLHDAAEEPSPFSLPEPSLPEKPLEIEIETPFHAKERESREKREAEFESYLRRAINRFTRQLREDIHKTHLLCLLANGMFRSRTCNEPELRAVALSLLPAKLARVSAGRVDIPYISKLLKWFVSAFEVELSLARSESGKLFRELQQGLTSRSAGSEEELVHLFLIVLRALPLSSRLVVSLQPLPFKESSKAKNPRGGKSKVDSQEADNPAPRIKPKTTAGKAGKRRADIKQEDEGKIQVKTEGADGTQEGIRRSKASGPVSRGRSKKIKCPEASAESGFEDDEHPGPKNPGHLRPKNERRRRVASKVSYREADTDQDDDSDSDFELADGSADSSSSSGGGEAGAPGDERRRSRGKGLRGQGKGGTLGRSSEVREEEDSESGPGKAKSKRRSSACKRSDGDGRLVGEGPARARASDQWIEVYADAEKKWVAVDCVYNSVNHPELCARHATKPLCYIIGFDNENSVRDVTQRYDAAWMTATRKRRVDPAWWEETLSLYRSHYAEREAEEDRELRARLLDQPLPTSIAEYKNHPLYVLQRHLLKYEILYPPTASILGYCRTEPVYSRDCVHVLHSKDTWLKEARVVRDGEVPCKMVKSQSNRARRARLANWENRDKDDLGLFGRWQTEMYHPPRATNGKVPRNEFGNVYLFKPSMLPLGCRHLRIPNLNRVARKLDIDCAAAVTGFDFHSGHSHPITDGYVVCEEYVEILLTACKQEAAEQVKREQMKREKRVLGNWKLLVKGLLIRDRLRARYSSQETDAVNSGQGPAGCCEEEGPSKSTPATDAASSWPLNRQEGEQSRKGRKPKRGEEKHLFPFERL
ncbi:DNA repair protein complementing XP-C cells [Pristis pectinata]|uniref:DNA repair protein complementing XP-C cells n=1 Tax=Pristis pectinata TaxID=685728 RepID=UPI00223D24FC|nr:DNA repair protein complementing XP-C cells [Pristis pectinata]